MRLDRIIRCATCDGDGREYVQDGFDDEGKPYFVTMRCGLCDGKGFRDLDAEAELIEADCRYDMERED